jgi:hypothetical protein
MRLARAQEATNGAFMRTMATLRTAAKETQAR